MPTLRSASRPASPRRDSGLLILFTLIRKITGLYIFDILLNSFGGLLMNVEILAEKARFEFCIDAKHVMHHQYLSIAVRTGANTDRWNMQTIGNFFCKSSRNLFKN